jgi:K+-transporting ATPase ATPase C chain
MLVLMTVLTGIIYPLVITAIAQVAFPTQANGSMLYHNGKAVGSELIGQNFTGAEYFHSRPSAAGNGYDASNSSGSNLGPTNKAFLDTVKDRAEKIRSENSLPGNSIVPPDLVTASASGLDPDISPAAAFLQVPRIAKARGLQESEVEVVVDRNIVGRQYGILGETRVNVLQLNLDMDRSKR